MPGWPPGLNDHVIEDETGWWFTPLHLNDDFRERKDYDVLPQSASGEARSEHEDGSCGSTRTKERPPKKRSRCTSEQSLFGLAPDGSALSTAYLKISKRHRWRCETADGAHATHARFARPSWKTSGVKESKFLKLGIAWNGAPGCASLV